MGYTYVRVKKNLLSSYLDLFQYIPANGRRMVGETKEVYKEQPPASNLSATVRRVVQDINVANQRPPFSSGLKSTYLAISLQVKSCLLLAQST
jgi:hypothetical protein